MVSIQHGWKNSLMYKSNYRDVQVAYPLQLCSRALQWRRQWQVSQFSALCISQYIIPVPCRKSFPKHLLAAQSTTCEHIFLFFTFTLVFFFDTSAAIGGFLTDKAADSAVFLLYLMLAFSKTNWVFWKFCLDCFFCFCLFFLK